jgi:hypothetical protein
MKIIAVDEKWSVRYTDRPIAWVRYGVDSYPFDHFNGVAAMFYTMLDDRAKLAKAVEIGNKMAASIKGNYYIPSVVAEWNAVLAELEGGE